MRGYSEVSNLILIRFDQIVEDMTAAASLIGISKKVIKQGLAEKLNVSEKHITTQQYSQARNIVQSSKHSEDYLMFDKIRRDFRQSWDK